MCLDIRSEFASEARVGASEEDEMTGRTTGRLGNGDGEGVVVQGSDIREA